MNNNNPFFLCPDCIESRGKLKSILLDFFPTERLKTNVVLAAFDEGIVDEIVKSKAIDNLFAGRFTKILVSDYGISEENAHWAIEYWVTMYAVSVLGKTNSIKFEQSAPKEAIKPISDYPTVTAPPTPTQFSPNGQVISVAELQDKEKLPKSIIKRYIAEEQKHGISDLRMSITKDFERQRKTWLKVTGEITAKLKADKLIYIMVYNANNELIEANFREDFDKDLDGKKTFSATMSLPTDEYITRVEVRFSDDPALFW